ncbi:MAG: transcriptional regulator [Rhizobiaceae bacterium]|nr:transcriptional regulator [Rhizobiaceae bacterium]
MKTITGGQVRAARALLKISAETIAKSANIGIATVRRSEADDGPVTMTKANALALQTALETAGIEFIAENGGGVGVRLIEKGK